MNKVLTQEDLDQNPILSGCSVGDLLTVEPADDESTTQSDGPGPGHPGGPKPPVIPLT